MPRQKLRAVIAAGSMNLRIKMRGVVLGLSEHKIHIGRQGAHECLFFTRCHFPMVFANNLRGDLKHTQQQTPAEQLVSYFIHGHYKF
jgi:hypothetical protein